MGRKKTYVGTAVVRVIDDFMLPHSALDGTIKAILQNGEINDYVLEEMIHSIGSKAERMYTWAENGNYVHGLPSGQYSNPGALVYTAVENVLESLHAGAPVTLEYMQWGPPNNLHIGWIKLIATHGYNPATNVLGALTASMGTTVWLDNMTVWVPEAELANIEPRSLMQWGIAAKAGYTPERTGGTDATRRLIEPSPIRTYAAPVSTDEYLTVDYVWLVGTVVNRGSFNIPVTGYDDNLNYFHARYTVGGVAYYWMYEDGAGTYPTLDVIYDTPPEPSGSYFPFIYFRHNSVSENADITTESYRDCKKLAKYIGMDFDLVADQVNSNPDIADVKQAVLMFAVPANTTDPLELRYLFDYFHSMYLAQDAEFRYRTEQDAQLVQDVMNRLNMGTLASGVTIQDARFRMQVLHDGIYMRKKAGSIGPIDTITSGVITETVEQPYIQYTEAGETPMTQLVEIKVHYYRRQTSLAAYEEIRIPRLTTTFHIFEQYSVIGDDLDSILMIPLDHSITGTYSIPKREVLYARSLHMVFNSLVVVKAKWYQTGIFKALMIVIAVVITVWSMGGLSGIAATLATMTVMTMVTVLLEFVLFSIAFKLFVKAVGIKLAFIIAIVAVCVGLGAAINAGSLSGTPFASELLQLGNGLTTAIQGQLKSDMNDLMKDQVALEAAQKEATKLLDKGKELLEHTIHLNPLVIFGERPDDFYNRTVHSGNIGVVGIEAVSAFVDTKLMLPQLNDTLGGDEYVG